VALVILGAFAICGLCSCGAIWCTRQRDESVPLISLSVAAFVVAVSASLSVMDRGGATTVIVGGLFVILIAVAWNAWLDRQDEREGL
jgi:hypothetical protein